MDDNMMMKCSACGAQNMKCEGCGTQPASMDHKCEGHMCECMECHAKMEPMPMADKKEEMPAM